MKSIRITLGVAAIALGTFTAFSFAPAKADSKFALIEYYMNPDGSRGQQVSGQSDCLDESELVCSQEYNTTTNLPTGNPAKIHYFPRP